MRERFVGKSKGWKTLAFLRVILTTAQWTFHQIIKYNYIFRQARLRWSFRRRRGPRATAMRKEARWLWVGTRPELIAGIKKTESFFVMFITTSCSSSTLFSSTCIWTARISRALNVRWTAFKDRAWANGNYRMEEQISSSPNWPCLLALSLFYSDTLCLFNVLQRGGLVEAEEACNYFTLQ